VTTTYPNENERTKRVYTHCRVLVFTFSDPKFPKKNWPKENYFKMMQCLVCHCNFTSLFQRNFSCFCSFI